MKEFIIISLYYLYFSDSILKAEEFTAVNLESGGVYWTSGECSKPIDQNNIFHSCNESYPAQVTQCTCTYDCNKKLELVCYNKIWYPRRSGIWPYSGISSCLDTKGTITLKNDVIATIGNNKINFSCSNGYKLIGTEEIPFIKRCIVGTNDVKCIPEDECIKNINKLYGKNPDLTCDRVNADIENHKAITYYSSCRCKSNCLEVSIKCTDNTNIATIKVICNKVTKNVVKGDLNIQIRKSSDNKIIHSYSCINNLTLNGISQRTCKRGKLTGEEPFCTFIINNSTNTNSAINSNKEKAAMNSTEISHATKHVNIDSENITGEISTKTSMKVAISSYSAENEMGVTSSTISIKDTDNSKKTGNNYVDKDTNTGIIIIIVAIICIFITGTVLTILLFKKLKSCKKEKIQESNPVGQDYPDYEYIEVNRIHPGNIEPISQSPNEQGNTEIIPSDNLYDEININPIQTTTTNQRKSEVSVTNDLYGTITISPNQSAQRNQVTVFNDLYGAVSFSSNKSAQTNIEVTETNDLYGVL